MNNFYLICKLYIIIFLDLSFLVHGQNNEEGTIYTKWPLCECIDGIKKDIHHDILTKETQGYREFQASIHGANITTVFNFGTIKSGNKRKFIFQNYPIEKFEPFIFQCDGVASWHGFQSVNIGKIVSSQPLFVCTVNCETSNDIHILMPFSHGCNQLPEGFKELDVDKSVVLDKIKKIKKLIVNCKVTGENLELDIHVPAQCANFNINLLSSPLLMHLQNEYFSDTTKRSISIKKTTDRKVIVTFFIDDKHPEEVTDFSKSILVWSNNKSEYYELTTKDLTGSNIKFTHNLLSENKSDEQCLNQQNLLLLSQPKLPLVKKRSADDAGLTAKAKGKKNSRVTIAKVQPVKKVSKTLPKDKPQTEPTVTPSATTEVDNNDVISKFTEPQQAELQEHSDNIKVKEMVTTQRI